MDIVFNSYYYIYKKRSWFVEKLFRRYESQVSWTLTMTLMLF